MQINERAVEEVEERIRVRRKRADALRGAAVGATVSDSAKYLRYAQTEEAMAEGMQRALLMLGL